MAVTPDFTSRCTSFVTSQFTIIMERKQMIQCTLATLSTLALPHHPPMSINDLFHPSRHFLPLFGFHFSLLIIPHEIRRRPRIFILPRPTIRTCFTSSVFADVTSVACFWCARCPVAQASPGTACTASPDGEAVELVPCWIVRHCLMIIGLEFEKMDQDGFEN